MLDPEQSSCWLVQLPMAGDAMVRVHGCLRYPDVSITQSQNLESPRRAECFSSVWSPSTWLQVPLGKAWKKTCGAHIIVLHG